MPSNNGIEQGVSDEGGTMRFNLSACLDSIGFKFFTHLALVGFDDFILVYKLLAAEVDLR